MNTDIRISTSFLNHRKRKKLKQILGPGSTDYLIDLWINTAINRPKGILYNMDKGDIALDAGWDGDAELFVDTLKDVGFLDLDGEWYSLHDWDEHQSWAIGADDRSLSASKNQVFRWCVKQIKKKDYEIFRVWYYETRLFLKGDNTESILNEYGSYTNGNTPILSPPIQKNNADESEPLVAFQAIAFLKELGVENQIAQDYLKVRKLKRSANTETAFNTLKREIEKTKIPANEIIEMCVDKSWAGFKALWLEGDNKSQTGSSSKSCQGCMSEIGCPATRNGKPPEGKKCFFPTNVRK